MEELQDCGSSGRRCRGQPKAGACLAIADSLRKVSGNGNQEAVKMRPQVLHWDQHNMGCLLRRTVGPAGLP